MTGDEIESAMYNEALNFDPQRTPYSQMYKVFVFKMHMYSSKGLSLVSHLESRWLRVNMIKYNSRFTRGSLEGSRGNTLCIPLYESASAVPL